MIAKGLAFTALVAGLIACGKFTVSPYVSKTPNDNLNPEQISSIKSLEAGAPSSFKIAVISDTHNYYSELQEQVEFINGKSDEYEFVVIGGDLTNLGLLREFETTKKILQKLRVPYVSAVGNHDLLSNGSSIFEQMFGPRNFSFTFKQTKFIVFNNNNWESSGRVPDLGYVEAELNSSTSTNNILIAHVSPLDEDRWSDGDIADMRNLVDTYGVDYFLNGHDHNPGEEAFGSATRVTIGASSKGKVLELSISNGGVSHQFVNF